MNGQAQAIKILLTLSMGAVSAPSFTYAADSGAAALEEIIVTAEKREADVQKSAIAISVIGGEELAAGGIVNTNTLLDRVPGLDITHANVNANISLRGLASGGSTQYADPVLAFNIGGVPLSRQYATAGAMYDLQRVELLKGPQGTLYGRNATVGALNLVPNRPTQEFGGTVGIQLGNYNAVRLTGALNLPLSDSLAARIAVATNRHDGYLTNGYDDADNQGVRASLLFEPSNEFSVLVWGDYYHDSSKGSGSVFRYVRPGQEWQVPNNPWFAFGPAGSCSDPAKCPTWGDSVTATGGASPFAAPFRSQSVVGDNGFVDLKQLIYAAQVDWQTPLGALTVLPAHVKTHLNTLSFSSGLTYAPLAENSQDSIEARLASDGAARLRWVAGLFYFREHTDAWQRAFEPNGWNLAVTPNLVDISRAAFGEATFSITDRFRVTGGGRYTSENKSQDGWTLLDGAFTTTTCPSPGVVTAGSVVAYGFLYPNGYCIVPNSGSLNFTNTSWKVGVEFDAAAQSLLYANVRTGFKAGGLAPALPPNTYKPEKLTAYEVGSKNRFFDNRLQANLEVFYWDYKDQQISFLRPLNPAGQTSYPVNVPGWIKGAELSLDAAVTTADRIGLDVLYEKGQYDVYPLTANSTGVSGGLTDYPRVNMPTWSSTLTAEHRFQLSSGAAIVLGGDAHYESEAWLRPVAFNLRVPGDYRGSFVKGNVNLGFHSKDDAWSVAAFVDNVTNKAVVGTGTSGTVAAGTFYRPATNAADARYATLEAPRTYGVRFNAKF